MKLPHLNALNRRLKVLIAPDKFKGTLTAWEAAEAMADGWRRARPKDLVELFPISDGGDGFGELYGKLVNAKPRYTRTLDAAHRTCKARWYWEPKSKTAIIDSSAAIGLAMLPSKTFHPFDLDTFGLGKLLQTVSRAGVEQCILGIGGSATNDGGFGLAVSSGWKFLDGEGHEISRWIDLENLQMLEPPKSNLPFKKITVAVDVQNTLLGTKGATRIYGPQKGMRPKDFAQAERALGSLARGVKNHFGHDFAAEKGAGAAGGLGFGLAAFLKAELVPGFELFAKMSGLQKQLPDYDLVLTGEGSLDRSSLMGKGVGELARLCKKNKVVCHAIGGRVERSSAINRMFKSATGLNEVTSMAEAKAKARFWVREATFCIAASQPKTPPKRLV